ncbi:non-homologous end-joining DNA ligase, partial [Chryseobacterium gleum]|uniref:non-homologous end-joining DNA ligase n=1 Tax=Chryseobacterium gleum TaxID=250 RepID=UPI0028AFEC94
MGLSEYRKKRSEEKIPEPFGGKSNGKDLHFVIQKHDASHLHYDFRLEMDGVLKSWAVPKGPSMDPDIKRLAMMVEDHPYDYLNFEGIIPKGQYGGGTVIVWDQGNYMTADLPDGDHGKQEKNLLHQLYSGKLKFILNGEKLKGEFALVKAHGRGDNGWLLMKLEDQYASKEDITEKDKSVISGKTIEQMEKAPDNVYGKTDINEDKAVKNKKNTKRKAGTNKNSAGSDEEPESKINIKSLLNKLPEQKFYSRIEPMLATLVDKPFNNDEWIYEVKWDGYRAVAFMNDGEIELKSRNDKSFGEKFYPIYDELKKLNLNAVIDGEIVVLTQKGTADFGRLQNWRSEADGDLVYYVFDILWYEGKDLKDLSLLERKEVLRKVLPESNSIIVSEHFETSGTEFLEEAKKLGLEGIMAKRKDSVYHVHNRSRDWLKIKANKRQEVVIGGYTLNDDSNKLFSSILVGVYEGGKFIYTGKVGTGFNRKLQTEMMELFK